MLLHVTSAELKLTSIPPLQQRQCSERVSNSWDKLRIAWLSCRLEQVLSIGETVEEVSNSGFLGSVPTLQTQLLVDDSLLQVLPEELHLEIPAGQ